METNDGEFHKKLLATFRVEAEEHIAALASGLLELERAPADGPGPDVVERVFREAHSLKGAARAVDLREAEALCQALEDGFAGLKGGRFGVTRQLLDLLYEAVDTLSELAVPGAAPRLSSPSSSALVRRIEDALQTAASPARAPERTPSAPQQEPAVASRSLLPSPFEQKWPEGPEEGEGRQGSGAPFMGHGILPTLPPTGPRGAEMHPASGATVRVSAARLEQLRRQTEELLTPCLAAGRHVEEARALGLSLAGREKARRRLQSARRTVERAATARPPDGLPLLLDHLDGETGLLQSLRVQVDRLTRSLEAERHALAGMAAALRHDIKELLLLPFASLTEGFPRLVRDLARDQGKSASLTIRGGGLEIDRRILEEIKDPLIHLLRNSLDHGIERPTLRRSRGKPAEGAVTLSAMQKDGGRVEIRVSDDGAGIDAAAVLQAAHKLGLRPTGLSAAGDGEDAHRLIFQSGLSTSPIITDISGRGLGLAIVQEKIEGLGGEVGVESRPGMGSSIVLTLPVTLAGFRGVLVGVGPQVYVLPTGSVERVIRVPKPEIGTVENRQTVALHGEAVALVELAEVLGLPTGAPDTGASHAVAAVIGRNRMRVAFQVDAVLGEQEVLVKPLGPQLKRVRNVTGACILGNGRPAVVLNPADLLKSATALPLRPAAPASKPAQPRQAAILVVEDSITSRSLLKNILESVGYRVDTAVDGLDAYGKLENGSYDLVVSDVEMPHMDGFELTAKVRAHPRLKDLPVVLVTALESREHLERGVDVGANAYIVKSGFEQSNLLEILQRLL